MNLGNSSNELAVEVRRILHSAYAPCLKNLHDLLENVDYQQVQSWAESNECQIEGLATAVLNGLEVWPLALHTLRILSKILSFRDAVLRQRPMLLATLLTEAIHSDQGFETYATTCIALLSKPLHLSIPAVLTSFVERLLARAVKSPSTEHVRPIYLVLSGVGFDFLDLLPLEIVSGLQEQLTRILNSVQVKEHSAILICLAVLRKLASRETNGTAASCSSPMPDAILSEDELVLKPKGRYYTAQRFFSARRASKTLDIVMVKAIGACSQNPSLSLSEIVESLELSGEIVDTFGHDEKILWAERNGAKLKKLYEKILRHDIDIEVKTAAFNFVASLVNRQALPMDLIAAFANFACVPRTTVFARRAMETYMTEFEESSIRASLLTLLQCASGIDIPTRESLIGINHSTITTLALTAMVPQSADLRRKIILSLSHTECFKPLERFLSYESLRLDKDARHDQFEICPRVYTERRRQLHQKICVLLLKTALHASDDEHNFDPSIASALLDKQAANPEATPKCKKEMNFRSDPALAPVSLFEAGCTPIASPSSHDWQDRLRQVMSRDAILQHEAIVRMVDEVCRDFELRCNDIERPLREEQKKYGDLVGKLEISQGKTAELEAQASERMQAIDCLENEKIRLSEQIDFSGQQLQALSRSLEEMRENFDQARITAQRAVENAFEVGKQQELIHLASVTGKDELLEERTLKVAQLGAHCIDLEDTIAQLGSENSKKTEETTRLQKLADEQSDVLEQTKVSAALMQAEIDQLSRTKEDITIENKALGTKVDEILQKHSCLKVELEAQDLSARAELSELRREHEECENAKALKISYIERSNEVRILGLKADLDQATGEARLETTRSNLRITELQDKVNKLRHDRKQRRKELAEAQDFRTRMMAVMNSKQTQAISTGTRLSVLNDVEHGEDTQHAEPVFHQGDDSDDWKRSLGSNTSNKSGPASKRNKMGRSPKPSPNHTSRRRTVMAKTPTSVSTTRREPLQDISFDSLNGEYWSQTQPQYHEAQAGQARLTEEVSKENDVGGLAEDVCDSSFGSNVFTSTDQRRFDGLGGRTTREIDDETTVAS